MKFTLSFLLIFAVFGYSFAALFTEINYDPKNPGKCTIGDLVLAEGESAKNPNAECGRLTCTNGATGEVDVASCGKTGYGPGCEVLGYKDRNAPYPKCCEKIVNCKH